LYQISLNPPLFFSFLFFFSVNEDFLNFRSDVLQRNTRPPLLAEARVAVQFATLSINALSIPAYAPMYAAMYGEGACCLGINTPDTSFPIQY
jgi:hypothetical protein